MNARCGEIGAIFLSNQHSRKEFQMAKFTPEALVNLVGHSPEQFTPATMAIAQQIVDRVRANPKNNHFVANAFAEELTPVSEEALWALCIDLQERPFEGMKSDQVSARQKRDAMLNSIYELACETQKRIRRPPSSRRAAAPYERAEPS